MNRPCCSRRLFLGLVAGSALARQKQKDEVIATATQDVTPRVGIVLSSFSGGEEHDGTKLQGLATPRPVNADLDDQFIESWVTKAIEMGSLRAGDLSTLVEPEDWVLVKVTIGAFPEQPAKPATPGSPGFSPGTVTDPRIVRATLRYLASRGRGARFTIAEGADSWRAAEKTKGGQDGWTSEWGGAFGGLSYRRLVEQLSKEFPRVRFETLDLNYADSIELPPPERKDAPRYRIARVLQQCDKLICIAPLRTDRRTGVGLTFTNYAGFAPGEVYGFPKEKLWKLRTPEQVVVDLFCFHPADFSILGGCFGLEGDSADGTGGSTVHYNLLVAGAKAVSVDAVAAALMGFEPEKIPYLELAEKLGAYGTHTVDYIWTRGNTIEEARRPFKKPKGW